MKKHLLFITLNVAILTLNSVAQQNKTRDERSRAIDSISYLLKKDKPDTNKVKHLNELGKLLMYQNPDTSIILGHQALDIISPVKSPEFTANNEIENDAIRALRANTLGILGVCYYFKEDYPVALDYFLKALELDDALKNKKGIAKWYTNIGSIYMQQGNYTKALDYYFKTMRMAEELGNEDYAMAAALTNIGSIFELQGDHLKAKEYYFKALKKAEQLGDKIRIAQLHNNLGAVYSKQADYSKALTNYLEALKLNDEIRNKNERGMLLSNIGGLYYSQGNYAKALHYSFEALSIAEELGNKNSIGGFLGNIGSLYTSMGYFKEAEEYLKQSIVILDSIGSIDYLRQFEESLSHLYDTTGRHELALVHYKKAMALKDTIFSHEIKKQLLRKEMSYEFDKKEAAIKLEHDKELAVAEAQKKKQQIVLWSVIGGLLLVVVFAAYVLRSLTITRQQKNIIEQQKNEVSQQKEKIIDSIRYAQRIQKRILIEESELQNYLPDSFIYYQPKDIVSGDFYWFTKVDDIIVLAAIDCTGYGVPGAFMSIIGNTLLNEIVNKKQKIVPSEILRLLNIGVYEALHQKKDGEFSVDGMVIALCSIDYKNKIIQYAGAKNPLYVIVDNTVDVILGDIHEIAGDGRITKIISPAKKEYTNHVIPMKDNMSIYLFSDGYIDQLGGNNKETFGEQRFKDLLLNMQPLSMQEQKELIASAHEKWKNSMPQEDDILVMGVKI